MEQSISMKKKAIIFSLLALLPVGASAQWAQIEHDEQKEKQWKSMENGPWDFAPDWYYWLMHNNYSGASLHWRWRGFKSSLGVEFDEDDSNVKRIMPVRVMSEETQRQVMKRLRTNGNTSRSFTRKRCFVRLTVTWILSIPHSRMTSTVCRTAYRKDWYSV